MQIDKKEAVIFLTINLFAPLLYFWTLWQLLSLWPFWWDLPERGMNNLTKLTLAIGFCLLALNTLRIFKKPAWRSLYLTTVVLNFPTLLVGDLSFLLAFDDWYLLLTSLR